MDIGWTELILIGVVALIVIGPKDLPEMFRTLGRFTAKLRSMSREFSRAMEAAAKESGVKDVAKDIKGMANPGSLGLNAVKDAAAKFEKWDPLKSSKPVTATAAPARNVTLPAGNQAIATPVAAVPPVAEPQIIAAAKPPAKTAKAVEGPAAAVPKKPRAPRKPKAEV